VPRHRSGRVLELGSVHVMIPSIHKGLVVILVSVTCVLVGQMHSPTLLVPSVRGRHYCILE
jgi:hypothetical protein